LAAISLSKESLIKQGKGCPFKFGNNEGVLQALFLNIGTGKDNRRVL
jgi:hypothetical protein